MSLPSDVVDRIHVLSLRRVEKECSPSATMTGITLSVSSTLFIFGNKLLSQKGKVWRGNDGSTILTTIETAIVC